MTITLIPVVFIKFYHFTPIFQISFILTLIYITENLLVFLDVRRGTHPTLARLQPSYPM
jgi:hypothetical protein